MRKHAAFSKCIQVDDVSVWFLKRETLFSITASFHIKKLPNFMLRCSICLLFNPLYAIVQVFFTWSLKCTPSTEDWKLLSNEFGTVPKVSARCTHEWSACEIWSSVYHYGINEADEPEKKLQMRATNCWTQNPQNTFNPKSKCTSTFRKMLQFIAVLNIEILIQQKQQQQQV